MRRGRCYVQRGVLSGVFTSGGKARRCVRASAWAVAGAVALAAGMPPAIAAAGPKEDLRPLDDSERGLIASLNDERRLLAGAEGRPLRRLSVSTVLTQAASDYAEYLRATGRFDHQADGRTAGDRAREAGWTPAPGAALSVGENLFEGSSPAAAYSAWKNSPSHAAVLFHPDAYFVGVGHSGDKWVLLVGGQCGATRCARASEPLPPGAEATAVLRSSRLRFRLVQVGRTVIVGVRVLRGEGRVFVRLRRADGRSARRLRVTHRGSLWRHSFRLPSTGRWRATISFRGEPGWTSEFVRLRPFVLRG